jgi:ribonuclease J
VGVPVDNICVIENGQVIEITDRGTKLNGRVPAGDVFVDGSGVGDVNHDIMHEREQLAQDGMVLVHVNIDRFTNEILGEPEIITHGFISISENGDFQSGLKKRITDAIKRNGGKDRNELTNIAQSHIYSETRRRPVIFINIGKS